MNCIRNPASLVHRQSHTRLGCAASLLQCELSKYDIPRSNPGSSIPCIFTSEKQQAGSAAFVIIRDAHNVSSSYNLSVHESPFALSAAWLFMYLANTSCTRSTSPDDQSFALIHPPWTIITRTSTQVHPTSMNPWRFVPPSSYRFDRSYATLYIMRQSLLQ